MTGRCDDEAGGDELRLLAAELRSAAVDWGASLLKRSRRKNRVADRIDAILAELRSSPDGRAHILRLMTDDDDAVRFCAAGDAVQWAPEAALPVLDALIRTTSIHAVAAKYVVKGLHDGTLPAQT